MNHRSFSIRNEKKKVFSDSVYLNISNNIRLNDDHLIGELIGDTNFYFISISSPT